MPRAISTDLKAHYALGTTTIAQCWRAQLRDGTTIAATTHSEDLLVDGVIYRSAQGFNPSNVESSSDLSVDNMEVDGYLASPAITLDDVHSGRWDYAQIILFEVNVSAVSQGVNILRYGTLGQVKAGRSIFTAELRGLTQKYSRRIVTLTTQECQADLGDSRCKINLSEWTVLGTVASESNNKIITDPSRTEAADFFTGGLLTFTSGLNEGQSMEVKAYSPGTIELFEGMPFRITAADTVPEKQEPVVPDTYSLYAGCQKRFYQDCIGKFANGINFRGFPHLPGVGVFGGFGTVMTPASVPGSQTHSPPPPPAPGPAPGPAPAPGGAFPNKILACYFETYFDSDPFRITDVPLDFNVIFIFNGKFNGDGSVNFVSATTDASNIQVCRNRGQKCIFTVGGSDSKFVFSTRAQSTTFVASIQSVIASLGGVDGVDFNNYEGSNQPAGEMVWIAQQLKSIYGSSFGITSPAGGNNGLSTLPDGQLIQALSNAGVLTFVNPQFYDWSGYKAAGWVKDRVDEWVSLVGDASKVVIGLSANYDFANSLTLAECIREYDAAEAAHSNIRGAFCWNARTNTVVGGNEWGSTMRTHVDNALATPPAPAPAPVPVTDAGAISGTVAAPSGSLSLTSYGAVGDGSTDNLSAIDSAIAAANAAGVPLFVPAGQFNYSACIHLDSVILTGAGATSVLYATDPLNSAIFMEGTNPEVSNLKMQGASPPGRQDPFETCRLVPDACNGFRIHNVILVGAAGAGIHCTHGANNGTITNNTVQDTLADSIHMNLNVHHVTVESNLIERSGDDGVATVSYTTDGGRVNNITARYNVIRNNVSGRGMSVVGGADVLYEYNTIENSGLFAGLYIAQEDSYVTYSALRVLAQFNTFTNCGSSSTGHAAVMVFSDGTEANDSITVGQNLITQSGSQTGIRFFGPQTNILFDRNHIIGGAADFVGDTSDPNVTIIDYVATPAPPPPAPAPPPPPPPPPATGGWGTYPAIPLISPVPDKFLQTGPLPVAYWAEDNPWGSTGLTRGTFTTVDGSTYESAYGVKTSSYGPNGEVAARFAWKYPKGDLIHHEVKAYPSLLAGKKPGLFSSSSQPGGIPILMPDGSYSGTSPSGATPGTFMAIPANGHMTPVNCSFAWQHVITPSGLGHLSFDIWLQDQSAQTSGFGVPPITHEIMIPLDYWGNYGAYPDGRNPVGYSHDVTIQGVLWHVYMERNFSMGWTFIVFEPDAPLGAAGRTLNLAEFLNYITTRTDNSGQRWANGSEYLSSIELGIEPVYGVGDLAITNFRVWQG